MSSQAVTPLTAASLTRSPSYPRLFLREARYEFIRLSRTRSFALSVIGFPVIFYLFFGLLMNHGEHIGSISVARYELAGYAVFGMVGAALFGVGVGLSSELAAGWLDLKRASPMPASAYLFAKCASAAAFGALIVSALVVMAMTMGHVSLTFSTYASMLGLALVGVIPFACLGLALALLVPFNAAPGIANMLYLPMSFCGGLWMPIMLLPHLLQKLAPALPTYHLAQLMLRTLGYPSAGTVSSHVLGLVGFTLLMLGIAMLAFRRRERSA
jgi:ABC-2 type transport system permease protein